MTPLISSLLFGCVGIMVEIVFNTLYDLIKYKKLEKIHIHILMYPVYAGSFHILSFIGPLLYGLPNYEILFFIVLIVYTCEFIWGSIYEKFGIFPWRYHHALKFRGVKYLLHVDHKITVLYAPFWLIFAYFIWEFYRLMVKLMIVWPLGVA